MKAKNHRDKYREALRREVAMFCGYNVDDLDYGVLVEMKNDLINAEAEMLEDMEAYDF